MADPEEMTDQPVDQSVDQADDQADDQAEEVVELSWSFHQDLVGMKEIAERLGVGYFRVRRWNERRDQTGCPAPVVVLRCGPVWDFSDWQGWYALWRITRGSETWTRKGDKDDD